MSLTVVSCYYEIPNKHGTRFYNWFNTTLRINCPYIIFTTANLIPILEEYRQGIPTYYVVHDIKSFNTYQYKDGMQTHPTHCPSVELNLVWNEKIHMMKMASELNIFTSDWYIWIDAGICTFRERAPPPTDIHHLKQLDKLPKNKLVYCSSNIYQKEHVMVSKYYHHVSGTFMMHRDFILDFSHIYYDALSKLIRYPNIWTDQVVLTHIYKKNPELFFKMSHGYGSLIAYLYR